MQISEHIIGKKRNSKLANLKASENNFINIEPYYDVSKDILSKLDDKHIFYCR